MSKPKIENWALVNNDDGFKAPEQIKYFIIGNVYGHPNPKHYDGKEIQTSTIVDLDIERKYVKTRNTEYELGDPKPEYQEWLDKWRTDKNSGTETGRLKINPPEIQLLF